MKKGAVIFMTAVLISTLASCSGENSSETQEPESVQTEEVQEATSLPVDTVIEKNVQTPDDGVIMTDESEVKLTYENPLLGLDDGNGWPDYGFGDPFVMRWNGRYYLYVSTKDGQVGIKCFTSDNLVKWKYAGICANEKLTMSAYAPEVVYYNGAFYMYTSPAGNGHYVLKSDSPTGPFQAVTENFGLSIDGDVFIDDNGKWYFYTAGSKSIMAYTMSAPDRVDLDSGVQTGAYMNGWTEGSMILKYNNRYYMTYTGNHVWCDGYRINYAVSEKSPLQFTPAGNNPILLSTDVNTVKGIGHSSTVLSPDLDSYYIVYHSSPTAPKREMNIDRIVLNGDRLDVLGPTVTAQERPSMPEVYSYFAYEQNLEDWNTKDASVNVREEYLTVNEGGYAIAKTAFMGAYTAEINLLSLDGQAGAYFDYADSFNYGLVYYDAETCKLTVSFTENGETTEQSVDIEGSFGEKLRRDALILLTIRKSGNTCQILVNNRMTLTCENMLAGGAVGVTVLKGTANFGFVGISSAAMQSSTKEIHKPIEGLLPAITCVEEELAVKSYADTDYVTMTEGQTFNYLVNVAEDGSYDLSMVYRAEEEAVFELYQNGEKVGSIQVSKSPYSSNTAIQRNIQLNAGMCALTVKVISGSADVLSFEFLKAAVVEEQSYGFESSVKAAYRDGKWKYDDNKLVLIDGCGKWLVGDEGWGDYTVEADITPTKEDINFGFLVRTKNPSRGGANDSVEKGTDFLQGYFIGLGNGSVFLGKQNYNWEHLISKTVRVVKGETYHLKAEVIGATIRVWIDDTLVIEYTDKTPFVQGRVGFRGHNTGAEVSNFTVIPN